MRLVRIDRLAPGGGAVELHPRLTVLVGAPPELRRRLLQTVRAVVGTDEPECGGLIEVSGVRLALDRATLDQLRLDPLLDPVLALGEPLRRDPEPERSARSAPLPPFDDRGLSSTVVASAGGDAPPTGSSGAPSGSSTAPPAAAPTGGRAGASRGSQLRAELREVTRERTRLGQRMEEVRRGLDSFSKAALDVCRGQIEALEARRSSLRAVWERDRDATRARRAELTSELAEQRDALDRWAGIDPEQVRAARGDLVDLLDRPAPVDGNASALAELIQQAASVTASARDRVDAVGRRLRDVALRLEDARADLDAAERAVRAPEFDQSVVRRLEQVRDEIFAVDDRQGRLGSTRNKRRIQELRAEEAVLLDRLGFDTYSAYVMGIPSVRADMDRSDRLDLARERLERAEHEAARARGERIDDTDLRAAARELAALLDRAAELLGEQRAAYLDADVDVLVSDAGTVADRLRELPDRSAPAPQEVLDAAVRLDLALRGSAGAGDLAELVDAGSGRHPEPDPQRLLADAERWLQRWEHEAERAEEVRRRVTELEAELRDLRSTERAEPAVNEWADVEAELDAALDRLAEAEDRVRSHEEAMDRLADLRVEELALRDRERALLAAIAAHEASPPASGPEPAAAHVPERAAPDQPAAPEQAAPEQAAPEQAAPEQAAAEVTSAAEPPPYRPAESAPAARGGGGSGDLHWRLIERLAEQRAVSFAGSVPLVVERLPVEVHTVEPLLERMDRMSDLVQIVVLSDDPVVVRWAGSLGATASVLRL